MELNNAGEKGKLPVNKAETDESTCWRKTCATFLEKLYENQITSSDFFHFYNNFMKKCDENTREKIFESGFVNKITLKLLEMDIDDIFSQSLYILYKFIVEIPQSSCESFIHPELLNKIFIAVACDDFDILVKYDNITFFLISVFEKSVNMKNYFLKYVPWNKMIESIRNNGRKKRKYLINILCSLCYLEINEESASYLSLSLSELLNIVEPNYVIDIVYVLDNIASNSSWQHLTDANVLENIIQIINKVKISEELLLFIQDGCRFVNYNFQMDPNILVKYLKYDEYKINLISANLIYNFVINNQMEFETLLRLNISSIMFEKLDSSFADKRVILSFLDKLTSSQDLYYYESCIIMLIKENILDKLVSILSLNLEYDILHHSLNILCRILLFLEKSSNNVFEEKKALLYSGIIHNLREYMTQNPDEEIRDKIEFIYSIIS